MFGGKMKGEGSSSSSISPLVSFILGAAMATVCVLFFMSASPGRRLVDIAAWSHNNGTVEHLRSVADAADYTVAASDAARNVTAVAAPAPAPAKEDMADVSEEFKKEHDEIINKMFASVDDGFNFYKSLPHPWCDRVFHEKARKTARFETDFTGTYHGRVQEG